MFDDTHEQGVKKVAVVALLSFKREAKTKNSKEIRADIREVLEASLTRIPWLILENVVVVEE